MLSASPTAPPPATDSATPAQVTQVELPATVAPAPSSSTGRPGPGAPGTAPDAAWAALVAELRAAPVSGRRQAYWRLYALARELALATRRRDFRTLEDDTALDAVAQLFERQLDAVLDARSPRSYVRTCVRFALRSALRRQRTADAFVTRHGALRVGGEEDAVAALDLRRACATLGARERDVLAWVAAGFDRHEIGAWVGLSRAGVDQLVSRARRKCRPGP